MTLVFDGTSPGAENVPGQNGPWWLNQSAVVLPAPGREARIKTVPDPLRAGRTCLRFLTADTDTNSPVAGTLPTPTANPRSQLISPTTFLNPGNVYWESFEVCLPSGWAPSNGAWVALQTAIYGAPFAGSPALGLAIDSDTWRWQRNANAPKPWEIVWQQPIARMQWVRFTWEFLFAPKGWASLYIDGSPTPVAGAYTDPSGTRTRVNQVPIDFVDDPAQSAGPWFTDLCLYYKAGTALSRWCWFTGTRVATTRAEAE